MNYPEVKIIDYNSRLPNLQRWGRISDNEWKGRIVSKVKIGELPQGWKLVGVSEWQLTSQNVFYEKGIWTGNIKNNIIEMGTEFSPDNFDQKAVKFGGRFRNIDNFSIILKVVIAFKNDKGRKVTGVWRTEYKNPDGKTGRVEQNKTVSVQEIIAGPYSKPDWSVVSDEFGYHIAVEQSNHNYTIS